MGRVVLLRIFLNIVQQRKQKLGVKITRKAGLLEGASLLFTLVGALPSHSIRKIQVGAESLEKSESLL